jgi:hypothetical protein
MRRRFVRFASSNAVWWSFVHSITVCDWIVARRMRNRRCHSRLKVRDLLQCALSLMQSNVQHTLRRRCQSFYRHTGVFVFYCRPFPNSLCAHHTPTTAELTQTQFVNLHKLNSAQSRLARRIGQRWCAICCRSISSSCHRPTPCCSGETFFSLCRLVLFRFSQC